MSVRKQGEKPLFRQLYDQILEEAKELPPDGLVGTIKELASKFQVGDITVRKALAELKKDGYVQTVRGGGIFTTEKATRLSRSCPHGLFSDPANLKDDQFDVPFSISMRKSLTVGITDTTPVEGKMWSEIANLYNDKHSTNISLELGMHGESCFQPSIKQVDIIQVPSPFLSEATNRETIRPIPLASTPNVKLNEKLSYRDLSKNNYLGVPVVLHLPFTMLNKRLFAQAGIKLPSNFLSWQDYLEICFAYARSSSKELAASAWLLRIPSLLFAFDSRFHDRETGCCDFASPIILDFLRKLEELGPDSGAVYPDKTYEKHGGKRVLWRENRLASLILDNRHLRSFNNINEKDIEFASFPLSPQGSYPFRCNTFALSSHSIAIDEAYDFINFLYTEEVMEVIQRNGFFHLGNPRDPQPNSMARSFPVTPIIERCFSETTLRYVDLEFLCEKFEPVGHHVLAGTLSPEDAHQLLLKNISKQTEEFA